MRDFLIGEIIAYRYWIFCNKFERLYSPHSYTDWKPNVPMIGNVNKCNGHAGVYSIKKQYDMHQFLEKEEALAWLRKRWWHDLIEFKPLGIVTGTVKIWGSVIAHSQGYRSTFASINSLETLIIGPDFTKCVSDGNILANIKYIYSGFVDYE